MSAYKTPGTFIPFAKVNTLAKGMLEEGEMKPGMNSPCWESATRCYKGQYRAVWIPRNGSKRGYTEYLHRHVFDHFYGIPKGKQVNHLCNNRNCCRPDHLYAGTTTDNMIDRTIDGTYRGGKVFNVKLTNGEVLRIAELLNEGHGIAQTSRLTGISRAQVSNIKHGHSWSWLTGFTQKRYAS